MKRLIWFSALSSTLLFALAAWAYPGGNHFDHHAVGHDFWRNSLCDVARGTALDGTSNSVGAALAQAAMSILAVGLGLFLWELPRSFATWRRRLVRALAVATVPAALAVVFLPTDRFSDVHGIAVVIAGLFGVIAVSLCAARPWRMLGVLTLVVSFAALGVYSSELIYGGPPRAAVPILEHFAAILLLAWMLSPFERT